MTYGTVKAKSLIYQSGGSDVVFTTSGTVQNGDNFSGAVVQGQLISGQTIVLTESVSGALIQGVSLNVTVLSGISGIFTTQVSGQTITGTDLNATNITGNSISGSTIATPTGDIGDLTVTGTISGVNITGDAGSFSTLTATSGVFTTEVSGNSYKASGNVTVITSSGDVRAYGQLSFPPLVGTSGQILTSNGDGNTNWETDVYAVEIVTTPITGEAGKTYVITEGTTLTLPASPATGNFLTVINRSNTITGTIDRNGENIMSSGANLTIDDVNFRADFIYYGGSEGWVFI